MKALAIVVAIVIIIAVVYFFSMMRAFKKVSNYLQEGKKVATKEIAKLREEVRQAEDNGDKVRVAEIVQRIQELKKGWYLEEYARE